MSQNNRVLALGLASTYLLWDLLHEAINGYVRPALTGRTGPFSKDEVASYRHASNVILRRMILVRTVVSAEKFWVWRVGCSLHSILQSAKNISQ